MKKIFLLLVAVIVAYASQATIKYVNINATGGNNGTSWTNAYTNLQAAFNSSVVGDTVWVANGIYKPSTVPPYNGNFYLGIRARAFYITNGISVYGGFAGNETLLDQRDYSTFSTILSGDIGIAGDANDNCGNILEMYNVTTGVTLDGFKIIQANGRQPISNLGYLVKNQALIIDHCNPTIANCLFTENQSGSVIFYSGSSSNNVTIEKCVFRSNNPYGTPFGGDNVVGIIKVRDSGVVNINECELSSNNLSAGVFFIGGSPTTTNINKCKIFNNNSSVININGGAASLNMYNSLVVGNNSTSTCIMLASSPIIDSSVKQNIVNCIIADNKSLAMPFGFMMLTSKTKISNSIIWGNSENSINQYDNGNSNHAIFQNDIVENGVPSFFHSINSLYQNPLFINPGSFTNAPFNADSFDYHVSYMSPAIDMGTDTALPSMYNRDMDDTLRPFGASVDIGCYEKGYCSLSTTRCTPNGDTIICAGAILSLSASGGNVYSWSTGDSTANTTIDTAGTYYVIVGDSVSQCRGRDSIKVIIDLLDPVVTEANNILSTGTFASYQWFLNNNVIAGATAQDYTPTVSGDYRVAVVNANGCSDTSAAYVFTAPVTGVRNIKDNGDVTIYPNPASDQLYIHWKKVAEKSVTIKVKNVLGQDVLTKTAMPNSNVIALPLKNLTNGAYFISIYSTSNEILKQTKFIKQ